MLLKSKNPEDLQAANRLIKNMVKEVQISLFLFLKADKTYFIIRSLYRTLGVKVILILLCPSFVAIGCLQSHPSDTAISHTHSQIPHTHSHISHTAISLTHTQPHLSYTAIFHTHRISFHNHISLMQSKSTQNRSHSFNHISVQ